MKKFSLLPLGLLVVSIVLGACSDTQTYADLLNTQTKAIRHFIDSVGINVISPATFESEMCDENGRVIPSKIADMDAKNQYVLFSNGVYMQVVDAGAGDYFKTRDKVIVRFVEHSIIDKDTTAFNVYMPNTQFENYVTFYSKPDIFTYTITGEVDDDNRTATGTFTEGIMSTLYTSAAVPAGWLFCLTYLYDNAHVRLIVPGELGTSSASSNVYPYFYDLRKLQID